MGGNEWGKLTVFLKTSHTLLSTSEGRYIGDIQYDVTVDVDAAEEYLLVEELIVVVRQYGRVVDGRKAQRRDSKL